MRRCKRCNKPIHDSAERCPTCGAPVEDVPEKATPQPVTPQRARTKAASPAADARISAPAQKPSPAREAASSASKKTGVKPKQSAPVKQGGRGTVVLLILAVIIAAALILVLVKRCGGKSASAQPASAEAVAAASEAVSTRVSAPDVVGLNVNEASEKLASLGLAADTLPAPFDAAYSDGAVLAQSVAAGEPLVKGDHVTLTVNTLPLSLEVLQISPRAGRITLSNLLEICRSMGTTNPNFDYKIVIHAVEEYQLIGGFRCLVGSDEETPISRVTTQLLREGASVKGFESAVAYEDSIAWTFALEDWMGFHFENVTGYEVSIASRVDASGGAQKTFLPEQVRSMAIVDSVFEGGSVRVDIPAENALTVRITDDALVSGYSNSPTAGSAKPKWDVKLVVGSYLWLCATVDGTNGEPQSGMRASGQQFVGKGSKAMSFDGVSYTVDGNVMVISVPIPADIEFDPYKLTWMEITTGDGAYTKKIKIQ